MQRAHLSHALSFGLPIALGYEHPNGAEVVAGRRRPELVLRRPRPRFCTGPSLGDRQNHAGAAAEAAEPDDRADEAARGAQRSHRRVRAQTVQWVSRIVSALHDSQMPARPRHASAARRSKRETSQDEPESTFIFCFLAVQRELTFFNPTSQSVERDSHEHWLSVRLIWPSGDSGFCPQG